MPVSANFKGSVLEQLVNSWGAVNANDLAHYATPKTLTLQNIFNTATTFILWALIGVAMYSVIVGMAAAVRHFKEIREELGHVGHSHGQYIAALVFHIAIRAGVLVTWFFYLRFFFGTVVLHCLYWLYTSSHVPVSASSLAAIILAFVVMTAALHVHVVLLRLLLLRPRVYGYQEYL